MPIRGQGAHMRRRREFLGVLGGAAAAWPLTTHAQQPTKVSRIGFLRVGPPPPSYIEGFRDGLREQGLIEGQHFVIGFALAQTAVQISDVAAELVARKVDIVLAAGTPSVFPAVKAAGTIPVVFVATFDPVAVGLVPSLARPGGIVTGMTTISSDLIAKRLQLAKEFFPSLRKIAILVRQASPTTAGYLKESQSAAANLGIEFANPDRARSRRS
jgi:putative tryptophan/tyrosine transport system substrate-binding protein